jgi:glycosyltransferase involved in cell wall biosynthesis
MIAKDRTTEFACKTTTIIVTGMHRSGTSLSASILQSCGVNMGEHLIGKAIGNEKGHFEDLDIVDFHKEALISQGLEMNGLTLVTQIPVVENLYHSAETLIKARLKNPLWGWKDPRTSLFLDFWDSLLPNAYYVIVYRAPWEVIDSLYRRGTDEVIWKNPEIAAEIWKNYNSRILEFCKKHSDKCLLINVSRIIDDPSQLISGIYYKFGIQLSMSESQLVDKDIFKVDSTYSEIPAFLQSRFPDIIELYADLENSAQQFSGIKSDALKKSENTYKARITNFWEWQLLVTNNQNSQHYAQLYFREKNSDFEECQSLRRLVFKHTNLVKFSLIGLKKVLHFRFDPLNDYIQVKINSIQFYNSGKIVNVNFKISSNAKTFENQIYLFGTDDSQIMIDINESDDLTIDELWIEIEYLRIGKEAVTQILQLNEKLLEKVSNSLIQSFEEKQKLEYELNELKETILKIDNQNPCFLTTVENTIPQPTGNFHEREIAQSGLFDENYYLESNPDVKLSGLNPLTHYLTYGGFKGLNPSQGFDSAFYLKNNKDVEYSGMNPLIHYILHGKGEGRLPFNQDSDSTPIILLTPFDDDNTDSIIQFKSKLNMFSDDYQKFLHRNRLTNKMINLFLEKQQKFSYLPFFSVIMPVYNPENIYLEQAISSVINQIYPHWELIIIDDHSNADVDFFLKSFSDNKKLRYNRLENNSGVSTASNEGIRLASGDYILFMDHDDVIEKDALVQIANFLQNNTSDILYTDDGTIDDKGHPSFPAFKPDWSPELALSFCYVRHIVVYSMDIIKQTGFYNSELNGSQDYDYFLRATHFAKRIDHLPIILYHWRNHNDQLHKNNGSMSAGLIAVQKHLAGSEIDWVDVAIPEFAEKNRLGIYSLYPSKNFDDLVSIIIPVRNNPLLLKKCIESIKRSTYKNVEIIIANDESDELQTVDYIQEIAAQDIKVLTIKRLNNEFNYSRLNNKAIEIAQGNFLILLNSDTEIISADWIEQMLMYCKMPGVGITGGKLIFPDQRIQHAGVVVTMDKKPAHHPFSGSFGNGYMNFDLCARNYSAVTAACLMISKSDFNRAGGFDEVNFKISSNDVDLCLRILESGQRIVYNPNVLIFHHEGASRNKQGKPLHYLSDDINLIRKHRNFTDSFYNPNQHNKIFFTPNFNKNNRLQNFDKNGSPIKLVIVTHNLNVEGAPLVMFKVAKHLHSTGNFHITVISQEDGIMRNWYEKEGIRVSILDVFPSLTKENYSEFINWFAGYLVKNDTNMVYANTLDTFWAIDASYYAEIPSIWGIHESIDPEEYYRTHSRFSSLLPWILKTVFKSNRNLFVCKSTMDLYEKYNLFANMDFIYNGINVITDYVPDKSHLRDKLRLPDKTLVIIVGTICQRKGQLDFVKAAKILLKSNDNLHFMIIGKNFDDDYYQQIVEEIDELKDIVILDNQENIMDYFNVSDIYVCSSYNESFPLVILEAMSCSLPIVTTPVFGISEQVTDGETALLYNPGEIKQLANKIKFLLDHKNEAKEMGKRAQAAVEILFREENMLSKYETLFKTVVYEDVIALPMNYSSAEQWETTPHTD